MKFAEGLVTLVEMDVPWEIVANLQGFPNVPFIVLLLD